MIDSYLPTQNEKSRRRGGFTLVELMVAIAIIALLAGLLFPVMKGVGDRGKLTVCSNNLKQLGLAFQQYLSDNQQRYPGGGQYQEWANGGHWVGADLNGANATGTNGGTQVALTDPTDTVGQPYKGAEAKPDKGALYSYVSRNAAVYVCPSEPNGEYKRLTYSMNCAIAGLNATVRMKKPTEVVLLVDENNANDGYFYTAGIGATGSTDALSQNHSKGGNLLFCDGHVKFYSYAALPLDNPAVSPTAASLKTRLTGAPRFWDLAFVTDPTLQTTPIPTKGFYTHPQFGSCEAPLVAPDQTP